MEITTAMVKDLRQTTSAGVLDCRKALEGCAGDFEKAVTYLREKGLAAVEKREARETREGVLEAYVHPSSPIAVLLELNCETDFVALTAEFRALAHDLALHIAFAAPRYGTREEVPAAVVERERAIYRAQALAEGKPERILDRIVDGKLDKFFKDECLLEQPFVKDDSRVVLDVINDVKVRVGENVVLRRFIRYKLGESLA